MVPANLQKVVETVRSVDAVFFAGDLVNTPDRASEWFDDNRGNAFFPALQGRAHYRLNQTRYTGGALIQSAPLYSAIGNHEVMGRFSETQSLNDQFGDAFPQSVAEQQHQKQFGKSEFFACICPVVMMNRKARNTKLLIFLINNAKGKNNSFTVRASVLFFAINNNRLYIKYLRLCCKH